MTSRHFSDRWCNISNISGDSGRPTPPDLLLVVNCTFCSISHRFRNIQLFINSWNFPISGRLWAVCRQLAIFRYSPLTNLSCPFRLSTSVPNFVKNQFIFATFRMRTDTRTHRASDRASEQKHAQTQLIVYSAPCYCIAMGQIIIITIIRSMDRGYLSHWT